MDPKVKAILNEMAFTRDSYKELVRRHIVGALNERCKALLGTKNDLPKWVAHWEREVDRLLTIELPVALIHDTKFKDRIKAAMEEVDTIRGIEAGFRRRMANVVAKDHGLKTLPATLTSEDLEPFWTQVIETIQDVLG